MMDFLGDVRYLVVKLSAKYYKRVCLSGNQYNLNIVGKSDPSCLSVNYRI